MTTTTVLRPRTFAELSTCLSDHPGARLVGGGTLEIPRWQVDGRPPVAVYLPAVDALRMIGHGFCGATRTLTDISRDAGVPDVVRQAASSVGGPALRSLATIGGNLAAAQPGCIAVALLAVDAEAVTLDGVFSIEKFLEQPLLLTGIRWRTRRTAAFQKATLRGGGGPVFVSAAVSCRPGSADDEWIVAVGGANLRPQRLVEAEQNLRAGMPDRGAIAKSANAEVRFHGKPADENYRRHLVGALVAKSVGTVLQEVDDE